MKNTGIPLLKIYRTRVNRLKYMFAMSTEQNVLHIAQQTEIYCQISEVIKIPNVTFELIILERIIIN